MDLEFLLRIVVLAMMTIVGTGISRVELGALLRMPAVLVGASLAQLVLLPLIAAAAVWLLDPPATLVGAVFLIAASPGGVMSNTYCSILRLNVALSVALTAVSGFLALAAMPLVLAVIGPAALGLETVGVPVGRLSLQLLLFLVLPVLVGMTLRHFFPGPIQRNGGALRAGALGTLLVFIALVYIDQHQAMGALLRPAMQLTVAFTTLALLAGYLVGSVLRLGRVDRAVLAVEFAVRNVGIASVVALATFQQEEIVAFAGLFVTMQAPLLLAGLLVRGRLDRQGAVG